MLWWSAVLACSFPIVPCQGDAACINAFGVGWTCEATSGTCQAPEALDPGTLDTAPATTVEPGPSPLTINEVLYDPSNEAPADTGSPLPGDANGDGVYVHDDDEFVELVNISGGRVDISGYALWDEEAWGLGEPRHVVDEGTSLRAGGALVVFGGGTPTGDFGDAEVQVATGGRLNLNNASDLLLVTDPQRRVLLEFEIEPRSNNPNESYTRNPDIIGVFEQHGDSTPLLFSPGTRIDGTPF